MTDNELAPDADLDERLRTAMSDAVPDVPAIGVIGNVEWRAVRRNRRVRESVAAGLVVLLGGGAVIGFGLNSGPHGTFAGPAATSTTSTSTTHPTSPTAAQSQEMGPGLHDGGLLPPSPAPCKVHQQTPTRATGSYCGPAPPAGNGAGPGGTCTGTETNPPCGPGVVLGRYYAYTMPGTCSGLITFDGKQWVSELPPPNAVPEFHVWMSLSTNGAMGWIGPNGAVGFEPYVGQALKSCG